MNSIEPDEHASPHARGAETLSAPRCTRCRKRIAELAAEPYFAKTGLCFWCAYVDAQG